MCKAREIMNPLTSAKKLETIAKEEKFYDNILARSLANFIANKRTDTWICNLRDAATSESEQFGSLLS